MTTSVYDQASELLSRHSMDSAYGTNLEAVLEAAIDRHGLAGVLQAIADLCNAKATHLEEAWQDKEQSRDWLRVERRLDTAIREAKHCGLAR